MNSVEIIGRKEINFCGEKVILEMLKIHNDGNWRISPSTKFKINSKFKVKPLSIDRRRRLMIKSQTQRSREK